MCFCGLFESDPVLVLDEMNDVYMMALGLKKKKNPFLLVYACLRVILQLRRLLLFVPEAQTHVSQIACLFKRVKMSKIHAFITHYIIDSKQERSCSGGAGTVPL